MANKTFTDEEIQKFKVASAKAHDGRVIQVDFDEPISATLLLAPFTRAEYAGYVDRRARDPQTAHHGALLSQLLYPGFAEVEALRQEWPVIPEDAAAQMVFEAGFSLEAPAVRRLDVEALPAGLDATRAKQLADENKGRRLFSVEVATKGLSCVMVAPLADTWLAARTAEGDARGRCAGIVASTESYILGAVAWSREELTSGSGTGLLDRMPALHHDLWAAYKRTGGDGTAVRRKSL